MVDAQLWLHQLVIEAMAKGKKMTVGELINILQGFDSGLKVVILQSESTGLFDAVACFEELVCEGRFAHYEALDEFTNPGLDMATAEKVVVIHMDLPPCQSRTQASRRQRVKFVHSMYIQSKHRGGPALLLLR